jgi:serine/threonine protein kinase
MEWVEGQPISQELSSDIDRKSRAILASNAIRGLHEHGWVHNDIKPSNLIFSPLNGLRLVDLGAAGKIGKSLGFFSVSPSYAAPERWANSTNSPSADVFSLGCLLHELHTSQKLFPGGTAHVSRTQLEAIGDVTTSSSEFYFPNHTNLIAAMLQANPDKRPSMQQICRELS